MVLDSEGRVADTIVLEDRASKGFKCGREIYPCILEQFLNF